jgi:hypothetical protein
MTAADMKNDTKRYIRKMHRWLGLIIGIQFLLWTLGGFYFAWNVTLLKQMPIMNTGVGRYQPGQLPLTTPETQRYMSPLNWERFRNSETINGGYSTFSGCGIRWTTKAGITSGTCC